MVTVPTDFPNLVSFYTVVGAGSRNEVEDKKSGYAHFFEHLMFRGSDNYPPFDLVRVDENRFRIEIAVAGFRKEDIEITAQQNVLIVSGILVSSRR